MAEGEKVRLSLTQIIGAALAAMVAAVAASFLGVYGTIIGAALMSVISTAGAVLYEQTVHRSKDKLNDLRNRREGSSGQNGSRGLWNRVRSRLRKPGWWKPVGAVSLAVFAVALGTVTVIELGIGKSLTAVVTGQQSSGGTSIGTVVTGGGGNPDPSRQGSEDSSDGLKRNDTQDARNQRDHESNPTGSTQQRQPDSGGSAQEQQKQSGTENSGTDNSGGDNSGTDNSGEQQQKQSGADNSGGDTSSTSNQQEPDTTRTPAPNPMPGDGDEPQQNQSGTQSAGSR